MGVLKTDRRLPTVSKRVDRTRDRGVNGDTAYGFCTVNDSEKGVKLVAYTRVLSSSPNTL